MFSISGTYWNWGWEIFSAFWRMISNQSIGVGQEHLGREEGVRLTHGRVVACWTRLTSHIMLQTCKVILTFSAIKFSSSRSRKLSSWSRQFILLNIPEFDDYYLLLPNSEVCHYLALSIGIYLDSHTIIYKFLFPLSCPWFWVPGGILSIPMKTGVLTLPLSVALRMDGKKARDHKRPDMSLSSDE